MIVRPLVGDLEDNWAESDPDVAHRSGWPVHSGEGSENTSLTYFEIDPGKRIGRHTHDADETIVLLSGSAVAVVGEEEAEVDAKTVVHVAAYSPHDVRNTGAEPLRLIGFFSKASVATVFDDVQMPDGTKRLGSPD